MAESKEFLTVKHCSSALNTALRSIDADTVFFLNNEGFISNSMCNQVLNPTAILSKEQKAILLVTSIRDRIEGSAQEYHKLVGHLSQNRRQYGSIVDNLNIEYSRLEGTGKHQLLYIR